jgi:TPR repeat protein
MDRTHPLGTIRARTSAIILASITIIAVIASYAQTNRPQESAPDSCPPSHLKDIEEEAKNGSAGAQRELADMYAQGRCVPKDYGKAATWYRRSADQGDTEAQFQLGKFFLEGIGVPQDPTQAADWFRSAAEHMHHGAQYALGGLYSQGRGVPKDLVKSYEWVRISSPKLDTHTRDVLATLAKKMTPAQVEDAEKHAEEWLTAHGETAQ